MLYRPQVSKQMLTIKEASAESEFSVSIIRRMTGDPHFAAFTINDGGRLFIARNAIAEYLDRMSVKSSCADEQTVEPDWNWNVPKVKHLSVDELKTFLGISRNTAYDLIKHEGFPTITIGVNIFIPTPELTKWLDKRAIRFHGLKRYNGIRKNN